jgi:hypothetical protein
MRRSAGEGGGGGTSAQGWRSADEGELPASQAAVEALPGGGVARLKHANAGRTSNLARPAKQRKKILQKVEEKYAGFGQTLATEHLGKTRSEG